jgi:hypothetical protein
MLNSVFSLLAPTKQGATAALDASKRHRKLVGVLFMLSAVFWTTQTSCSYHQRFFIIINENRNPCIGVSRFVFQLTVPGGDGSKDRQSGLDTKSAEPEQLLWVEKGGTCQNMKNGIPIKEVDYGTTRQLSITGFDSANQIVSLGQSTSFQVEASGKDIETRKFVDLVRGCSKTDENGTCTASITMETPTLIIRFPTNSLPFDVSSFQFVIDNDPKQPVNFQKTVVPEKGTVPQFLILTNIPTGTRGFTILAFNEAGQTIKTFGGTYTLGSQPPPQQATARAEAQAK